MAETDEGPSGGGGLSKITGILNKKVAGMPVWLISVVVVVILVYVIKRRQDAKAASSADSTGSLAANIANQAFPYAAPMNFSSDVFVNNQMPGPPPPPVSSGGGSGGGTTSPMQHYVTFQKGSSVVDTITNLQKQGVDITYDRLVKLNKGLNNSITWDPVNLPNSDTHKRLDTWASTVVLRLDNSVPDKTSGGH